MRLCRRNIADCSIRLAQPCTVEGQLQEYMGQVNPLSWLIAPSPTGDLYNVSYAPAYSSYRKVCPAAFSPRSCSVCACGAPGTMRPMSWHAAPGTLRVIFAQSVACTDVAE